MNINELSLSEKTKIVYVIMDKLNAYGIDNCVNAYQIENYIANDEELYQDNNLQMKEQHYIDLAFDLNSKSIAKCLSTLINKGIVDATDAKYVCIDKIGHKVKYYYLTKERS